MFIQREMAGVSTLILSLVARGRVHHFFSILNQNWEKCRSFSFHFEPKKGFLLCVFSHIHLYNVTMEKTRVLPRQKSSLHNSNGKTRWGGGEKRGSKSLGVPLVFGSEPKKRKMPLVFVSLWTEKRLFPLPLSPQSPYPPPPLQTHSKKFKQNRRTLARALD